MIHSSVNVSCSWEMDSIFICSLHVLALLACCALLKETLGIYTQVWFPQSLCNQILLEYLVIACKLTIFKKLKTVSISYQTCSIFYTERFCISCVQRNKEEFPDEILKVGCDVYRLISIPYLVKRIGFQCQSNAPC